MAGKIMRGYLKPLRTLLETGAFGQLSDAELLSNQLTAGF
jgi:hypothetical protein